MHGFAEWEGGTPLSSVRRQRELWDALLVLLLLHGFMEEGHIHPTQSSMRKARMLYIVNHQSCMHADDDDDEWMCHLLPLRLTLLRCARGGEQGPEVRVSPSQVPRH